jgi:hypothetical protein
MFKSNYANAGTRYSCIPYPKKRSKLRCWFRPVPLSKIFWFAFKVLVLIATIALIYWCCALVIELIERIVISSILSLLEVICKVAMP